VSKEGLWRDILEARYDNWMNMDATLGLRKESLWWKDLCRVSGNRLQGNWFDCRFQWSVGDGRSVKVLKDRWVDDQALKEKFPRLYSISQSKDSLVGDIVYREENKSIRCQNWNLSWGRERFEWEKHLEDQTLTMIPNGNWKGKGQDRLIWVGGDH